MTKSESTLSDNVCQSFGAVIPRLAKRAEGIPRRGAERSVGTEQAKGPARDPSPSPRARDDICRNDEAPNDEIRIKPE